MTVVNFQVPAYRGCVAMIATARRFSGGRQAGAEIEAHQGSTLRDPGNKMRDTAFSRDSTAGESCAVLFLSLPRNPHAGIRELSQAPLHWSRLCSCPSVLRA